MNLRSKSGSRILLRRSAACGASSESSTVFMIPSSKGGGSASRSTGCFRWHGVPAPSSITVFFVMVCSLFCANERSATNEKALRPRSVRASFIHDLLEDVRGESVLPARTGGSTAADDPASVLSYFRPQDNTPSWPPNRLAALTAGGRPKGLPLSPRHRNIAP